MVLGRGWRRGWQIENQRQNVVAKVGPVKPDATRYGREQRHDGMLSERTPFYGSVFAKSVLMPDPSTGCFFRLSAQAVIGSQSVTTKS